MSKEEKLKAIEKFSKFLPKKDFPISNKELENLKKELDDKEEVCKGCPQINDCGNTPSNCLRRWSYLFTGKWN